MQPETEQPPRQPRLIALLLISALLLALSLVAGQWLIQQDSSALFAPDASCQLPQQPCISSQDARSITLSIDTAQLDSHQPLPVRVELNNYDATRVTLELQGAEMYMGENLSTLTRQDDGSYQASVQLPACPSGTMRWRATVRVTHTDPITQASQQSGSWFEFEAG